MIEETELYNIKNLKNILTRAQTLYFLVAQAVQQSQVYQILDQPKEFIPIIKVQKK